MRATQPRRAQCARRSRRQEGMLLLRSRQQPVQQVGREDGGDHAATCSCVLQLSVNNSGRAALKYCKRYPGMPFLRHWDTAPVVTSHISATFDVPPSRSMRFSSFMLAILDD